MKKPDFLLPGDLVAIIATARFVAQEDLDQAKAYLENWGFRVVCGQSIGAKFHQLAGSDTARAQDLQWALDHPEIKAIWCARGGYGTIRILDEVNFEEFTKYPKWIIGYSDVTALHARIQNLGWASLHGQMPLALGEKSPATAQTIKQALTGEHYTIEWSNPYQPLRVETALSPSDQGVMLRTGGVTAPVVGGNLSLIYSLQGSPDALDARGKILFIEDLDEYLYHIDRMMHSLKRSGLLQGLAGLIVGGMTDMKDHEIPFGYDARQIIWAAVAQESYPVVFDAPIGHLSDNRALPFGLPCSLTVNSDKAKIEVHGKAQ
jgi:muramoyltetrapeptide carboxypeptidase